MVIKNSLDNSYWNLRNKPYSFTHILLIWMSKDNFGSMVVITWSRFGRMKFCPTLSGSRQYCKLYKFYPAITSEKFHPGKAVFLFCTAEIPLAGTKFSSNAIIPWDRSKSTFVEERRERSLKSEQGEGEVLEFVYIRFFEKNAEIFKIKLFSSFSYWL